MTKPFFVEGELETLGISIGMDFLAVSALVGIIILVSVSLVSVSLNIWLVKLAPTLRITSINYMGKVSKTWSMFLGGYRAFLVFYGGGLNNFQ